MAFTAVATQPLAAPPPTGTAGALTPALTDGTNGNAFVSTGRELLLIWNPPSAGATTLVIHGVPDQSGRPDPEASYTIPAGAATVGTWEAFGPFPPSLWRQNSGANAGQVTFKVPVNTCYFLVIETPAIN